MVKTQVQIPDHLYREAKRVAKEYEMSFAEVVRRGLERIIANYPKQGKTVGKWSLPSLESELNISLEDLRETIIESESSRWENEP